MKLPMIICWNDIINIIVFIILVVLELQFTDHSKLQEYWRKGLTTGHQSLLKVSDKPCLVMKEKVWEAPY